MKFLLSIIILLNNVVELVLTIVQISQSEVIKMKKFSCNESGQSSIAL
jgi:hypothetical protein